MVISTLLNHMDLKNTQKGIVLVHMQELHFLILNLKLLMKMMSMNSSRSPTDPNKKFTLEDAFALQRNRFEHLNGRFIPDDQIGVKKQGDNGANDAVRKDQYKYALGNENVIDAHVYQIDPKLPKSFGGKGMARFRTIT